MSQLVSGLTSNNVPYAILFFLAFSSFNWKSYSMNAIVYYLLRGRYTLQDDMDHYDLETQLEEVQQNVEDEFRGEGREFSIMVDFYDSEAEVVEIMAFRTYFPYEDEDSDLELILEEIKKQMEDLAIEIEEIEPLGVDIQR